MKEEPIFTVIVPTYNREFCLKRAIDSILAQTFKGFELIIIDDGSTDETENLIKAYDDDRIIYIYKENGGLNSARNMALKKAKGEYIAFCDSDDSWMPEKLEKHLQKYQEDDEVKVVYDLTGIIMTENGIQKAVLARNDTCEGWCYKEVLEQGYLTSPTFLSCKKECFDKVGELSEELTNCEDDDLCFRLCRYFKVGLIKEILGIYHTDAVNRISLMKKLCADDNLKFLEKWKDEIIRMCGMDVLRHKYYKVLNYYMEIKETDTAKEIYRRACKYGNDSGEKIKDWFKENMSLNDTIIIYGIGEWGEKVLYALKVAGFDKFIFAVTDMAKAAKEWHGEQVQEIRALNLYTNAPLIIASTKYYDDMKEIVTEKGFTHVYSCQEVWDMIFY